MKRITNFEDVLVVLALEPGDLRNAIVLNAETKGKKLN